MTAVTTGKTPFYAEQGGQVGDTGVIAWHGGGIKVSDTQKIGDVFFHLGKVEGNVPPGNPGSEGSEIELEFTVDAARRDAIMANHTSTHVMNRALRAIVNPTADQRGSLVDDEKLRFDFSHQSAVTAAEIEKVEQMVNADIAADLPVHFDYVPQEKALKIHGLRAVFGEKYPPVVRVVSIGRPVKDLLANPDNPEWAKLSIEFCGGTHLAKTGDAEGFAIISEEAVGKGVRRITALTGRRSPAAAQGQMLLARLDGLKNAPPGATSGRHRRGHAADGDTNPARAGQDLAARHACGTAEDRQGPAEAAEQASGGARWWRSRGRSPRKRRAISSSKSLRTPTPTACEAMDVIRKKRPDAAILLGGVSGDKVSFVAAVPEAMIKKGLKAGDWVREVAKVAGGGGGGRPDMAQAGGKDPAKIDEALAAGRSFAKVKV